MSQSEGESVGRTCFGRYRRYSVKKINEAINEFLRTPEMERMTRKVQTEAFKQVAAHYGTKCEIFKTIRTQNDSIYHQMTIYDTLYTALQTKYKDLLDE